MEQTVMSGVTPDQVILDEGTDYELIKNQADVNFEMAMARVERIGKLMNWRTASDNRKRAQAEQGLAKIYQFMARFQP